MPCNDVTELIRVVIDPDDRLRGYEFTKRTCGQGVGQGDLLGGILAGRSVDELLALTGEGFLEQFPVAEGIEEFLSLKHLFAIQSALRVLIGAAPCGTGQMCAASEIICDESEDTHIHARITVDLLTEEISACGNCGSCGRTTKV